MMRMGKATLLSGICTVLLIGMQSCGQGSGNKAKASEVVDTTAVVDTAVVASSAGIQTVKLDSVTVTWIGDNAEEKLMEPGLFKDASDSLMQALGLQDGVPSTISTFLVETGGIKILFDTGLGTSGCRLLGSLEKLGLAPTDIHYLYLTHFHGDHIGGMMDGDNVVFPNAQVYASRVEYEAWMAMSSSRNAQQVKTMQAYQDRLHLFEFGDTLPGGVTAIDAVGHTPGHTVFQAGKLLIIADLMHGAALQLLHPEICAAFDMDKEAAVSSRIRILNYAKENGLLMAGMHLPAPAFLSIDE